ncbi:MAG: NADH-quinone oxidoreductase subunit L [Bacteroidales bacterium]
MLPFIPLLPFVGYLINLAFGRRLSKTVSAAVACLMMAAAFVLSLASVVGLLRLAPHARVIDQTVYDWIASGDFLVPLAFRLDPLSAVMILVVTGIGFLIHVYSAAYMEEETPSEYARYFSYLNLFAAFMLVLVLGASFLVMFVGWEGVGLCSYLLIGFWYKKKTASDAGKKAFIVNRIGDYGFLLGMLLIFSLFGSLDFQKVAQAAAAMPTETASFGALSLIALLLFVGATGKSAQIPLYIWLPDAMEGPTPVSALIHAATMVTAGVYMIGRNAVLFSHAPQVLQIVAIIGAATAFFAATIGLVQNDIKRVLAYSTVSQLGYMFLAMGVGAFGAGIFHLYTHAFFKALLFLGAGAVIHALAGEQDMRRMGGLRRELPVTFWTFLIATVAIAGVPGLAGFFSKDEILYRTYANGHVWLWLVGTVTSFLTAIYMFRVVFLTFYGTRPSEVRSPTSEVANADLGHRTPDVGHRTSDVGHASAHLHDAPPLMAVPLMILAIGAVVAGYVGVPPALGGSNRIDRFLEPSFTVEAPAAVAGSEPATTGVEHLPPGPSESQPVAAGHETPSEAPELGLMLFATVVALAGIALSWLLFLNRRQAADALAARFPGLYRLLLNKYYVDEAYDAVIVEPLVEGSEHGLWRTVDAGLIDGSVNGVGRLVRGVGGILRLAQTGSIRAYAASLFIGVVLVLAYYVWR